MQATFLAWALVCAMAGAGSDKPPVRPFETGTTATPPSKLDELVLARLKQLKIEPAHPCSDEVFLRRVYLDATGTLPTADEVRAFLKDTQADKRCAVIDELLKRDEFADYAAMKWGDVLRIKAEFPINLWPNAAQAYHRWIRTALKENMPYDRFARELLTASGSNFRVPPVNFYRAVQSREPEGLAQAVALTLMGTRADKWPAERLGGMAAFFAEIAYKPTGEWKEEIIRHDSELAAKGPKRVPVFPDGKPAAIAAGQDPREVFADWLLAADNPYFARAVVNRIWSWLLGRGIVHEADDLRPDNPPSNPELLAYLEKELVTARYDLKHIYRLILNSQTYQRSSIPQSKKAEAEAQFAHYPVRRLEAEVLIDALNQITGTTEKYSSAIPEPFTFLPENTRSIALPDGSVTSSFLELFGRPPRDTGMENERNNRPTAGQRLHLLNSSHVQRKIENSPKFASLMLGSAKPRDVADGMYLAILSRYPTGKELLAVADYARSGSLRPRDVAVDLAWALINSSEFTYRH